MIKRLMFLLVIVMAAVAALAGCDSDTRNEAVAPSDQADAAATQAFAADDVAGLTEMLKASGAEVTLVGPAPDSFLTGEGTTLQVNGQEVQVFEYEDANQAENDSSQISSDGAQIGDNPVRWAGTPHFYRSGKMIVQYIGDDQSVLQLLDDVLGPQFAGG